MTILARVTGYLDDLISPKPDLVHNEVACMVSPFTSQYNKIVLEVSRMRREYESEEKIQAYIKANPITDTDGQYNPAPQFPTAQQHREINRLVLDSIK